MRRTALPLLLRLADAAPVQQQLSLRGQLTRLQALLLQATGHIGFAPGLFAQAPSELRRTLFGVVVTDDISIKKRDITKLGDDPGEAACNSAADGVGDGNIRGSGNGNPRVTSADDVASVILSRRTRLPGCRTLPVARAAQASDPPLVQSNPEEPSPPPPPPLRSDGSSSYSYSAPSSPYIPSSTSSYAPPSLEVTTGLAMMTTTDVVAMMKTEAEETTTTVTMASTTTAEAVAAPSIAAEAPPSPRFRSSRDRSDIAGAGTARRTRSIYVLLDELELSNAPPPPPNILLDSLEQWRKRNREAAGPNIEVDPHGPKRGENFGRRAVAAALATRLDQVLAPRLKGEYGKGIEVKILVLLLWSLAKGGLFGDTAMALVGRLEDSVQPDMPYGKDEYWASLAFYSLGLAQQAAAAGGGGAAAAAAAALVERSRQRLAPALLTLLGRKALTINPQGLSNTFWAAGLLQMRDEKALHSLAAQAHFTAKEATSQSIANIFYGCAVLGLSEREWHAVQGPYRFLERLLSECVRRELVGFQPLEISCVAWAACKLGLKPSLTGSLLKAVATLIDRGGFDQVTSAQVWSNTLYAMGVVDFYDPRVFQKLSDALLLDRDPADTTSRDSTPPPHLDTQHKDPLSPPSQPTPATVLTHLLPPSPLSSSSPPTKSSMPLAASPPPPAAAAAGRQRRPPDSSSGVGGGSPLLPPLLRSATAQTCGNVLFAMGAVRHLDERMVDVLLARIVQVVLAGRASVVDVALAVRGCAQLNYRAPLLDELLDAAMPAMKAEARRLMAYNVLWSMLILGMLGEDRHQPLVRYLVYCVNRYGTSTWKAAPSAAVVLPSSLSYSQTTAYDDLTQLVQYHLESRYLGLVGPKYDLTPSLGMDFVLFQIRERRRQLAAQSNTVVHQNVIEVLKEMAAAPDSVTACVRHPRILRVEAEVMVEPELVVVDVLLTLCTHHPECSSDSSVPSTTYKVALEVDGPHHFMRNRPDHQDGSSAYRDRVLQRRFEPVTNGGGGGVAVVQTKVWVEQLPDDAARRRYLAELLASTAPPPPPPPPQPSPQPSPPP